MGPVWMPSSAETKGRRVFMCSGELVGKYWRALGGISIHGLEGAHWVIPEFTNVLLSRLGHLCLLIGAHLFKLSSILSQRLGGRDAVPLKCLNFKRQLAGPLERHFLGYKTGQRLKKSLHPFQKSREKYCNFSKVNVLRKGRAGPTVRKNPV